MLNVLNMDDVELKENNWLTAYWTDFRKRFISLLSYQFSSFTPALTLSILSNNNSILTPRRKHFFPS